MTGDAVDNGGVIYEGKVEDEDEDADEVVNPIILAIMIVASHR